MQYQAFGDKGNPTVILLHGAGLSWWANRDVAELLSASYYVVLPMTEGYGDAAGETFQNIEQSAEALITYINAEHQGHVFALGGLSLGAQIAAEALSRVPALASFAVLESALVDPIRGLEKWIVPTARMSYGLLKHRWFAKLQARTLCLPDALFENYYRDSLRISLDTLTNTLLSNGTYTLKDGLARTQAKLLVIVGEREVAAERKSANLIASAVKGSELWVVKGMKHGELSLLHPQQYVDKLRAFFGQA